MLIADTISPLSGAPSPDMNKLTSFHNNSNNVMSERNPGDPSPDRDSGSKISNSGVTDAEKDYDEYFDHGEIEEYINIKL